jgi:type I restriction enzyme S subunit
MSNRTSEKQHAKRGLVPKLRFREFDDAPEWKAIPLSELSIPVVERVGERKLTPVSISAGIGFVPQSEKFGRDISGNQYQLYTVVKDGDFVYNKGNSLKFPQGCVYLLRGWGEVAAPNVFICFRLKKGYSNAFFQKCFEKNVHGIQLKRHITSGARSNGLLNISKENFFGVKIPTPTFAEQQKIADCLTSIDELIAAQRQKLDALKSYKKGLLQQLFPREGETVPRLRFPEFKGGAEWKELPLSELVESLDAGVSVNAGDRPATNGEIGVLKISAVTSGIFEPKENKAVLDPAEIGRVKEPVRGDTIIISRANTAPLVGASAYVETTLKNIFLPDKLWAAKPKPGTCMRFLAYILGTNKGRVALSKLATGTSDSMKNITKPDVLALLVMAPSPAEQQHVASCLTSLDELIAAEAAKLESINTHKKALMQQLFPSLEMFEA